MQVTILNKATTTIISSPSHQVSLGRLIRSFLLEGDDYIQANNLSTHTSQCKRTNFECSKTYIDLLKFNLKTILEKLAIQMHCKKKI